MRPLRPSRVFLCAPASSFRAPTPTTTPGFRPPRLSRSVTPFPPRPPPSVFPLYFFLPPGGGGRAALELEPPGETEGGGRELPWVTRGRSGEGRCEPSLNPEASLGSPAPRGGLRTLGRGGRIETRAGWARRTGRDGRQRSGKPSFEGRPMPSLPGEKPRVGAPLSLLCPTEAAAVPRTTREATPAPARGSHSAYPEGIGAVLSLCLGERQTGRPRG